MDNFSDLIFTSFTKFAFVLLFSNSAEELVVTSGVIISEGRLIGEVLWILIEALFEIVKVSKSSTVLQELKRIDKKAVRAIIFDFMVKLSWVFRYVRNKAVFGFLFLRFKVTKQKRSMKIQSFEPL